MTSPLTHAMTAQYAADWRREQQHPSHVPQWIRDAEADRITEATWRDGYAWKQVARVESQENVYPSLLDCTPSPSVVLSSARTSALVFPDQNDSPVMNTSTPRP